MDIDKTTGRGCVWSMVSILIAKKLYAEGVVGKPLFKQTRSSSYDSIRTISDSGYYVPAKMQDISIAADEPLWTPSCIDKKLWEKVIYKFRTYTSLEENIEIFVLPEMDEYLQSMSDAELIKIARDFLVENGVINKPIRQRTGKTYYFNTSRIYSLDKESRLFPYEKRIKFGTFKIVGNTCFNMNVWSKAASQFKLGATLDECIEIFLQTELVSKIPQHQSPLDQLIQYISKPIYERVPENQDESTFDRIRVTVGLPRYRFTSWESLQKEVIKYRLEIYQRVVQKIEQNRRFKAYCIPITYLKLSDAILLHNFSIEYIFERK